nr:glycosyltransferase [Nesterenkonia sp. GX14115]
MLRLFFDARYTRPRVHDGISRFTAGLIGAAAEQAEVTMLISDEEQLPMLPDLPSILLSPPTSTWEPWVPRQINPHRPDVVFSPMQTMGGSGRRYPLILTLHDLIYYQHRTPPRDLPRAVRFGWRLYHLSYAPQRWTLDRADAVATVSETTRSLIRAHRLTRRPVELIPNAPHPVAEPRDPQTAPGRDLVYMGSFMEYKNVEGLIRGVNRLPEHRLHLCSPISDRRRTELVALADRPDQLIFHDGIDEEAYVALLRRAQALVTLSRAEGYGLPVVEAMAQGTPVITSDLPIFAEVTGSAQTDRGAQQVPCDDPAAFAAAVGALGSPGVFPAASRAARRRTQGISWQDSARRLVRTGERLAAAHRRRSRPWS